MREKEPYRNDDPRRSASRNLEADPRDLFENLIEGLVLHDVDGNVIQFNSAALRILGVTAEQLLGSNPLDPDWRCIHPDGRRFADDENPARRALATGEPQRGVIMGVFQPGLGELRWLKINALPLFSSGGGKARGAFVTFHDFTREKNAHQDLEGVFALSGDMMGIMRLDGRFIKVNPAYTSALGWTTEDFRERPIWDIVHPDDLAEVMTNNARLREGLPIRHTECRTRAKSGEWRVLSTVATSIPEQGICYFTARDVTDAREQEIRMLHASKMSALGEMAGGIAHEINNPLAIILGRAQQILLELREESPKLADVVAYAKSIENTVRRIAQIIQGMRSFSRNESLDAIERVSVRDAVEETFALCRERFRNHSIALHCPEIEESIAIDFLPAQFAQVLMNLLNNAFDAVHALDERWIRVETRVKDRHLELSVVDSGPGIPFENRERIMKPFFTTKGMGKGTGLGLSITLSILQAHGGELFLDEAHPHTRFVVRVPLRQAASVA